MTTTVVIVLTCNVNTDWKNNAICPKTPHRRVDCREDSKWCCELLCESVGGCGAHIVPTTPRFERQAPLRSTGGSAASPLRE